MGTRGAYGFKRGNKLKLTYNHYDSYFNYLGDNLIKELHDVGSLEKLNDTYDYIKLVKQDSKPTKKQIKECEKYCDLRVSEGTEEDWYCLLRNTQGSIKQWVNKEFPYMINSNNFIEDDIFCEYYYIIDLNTNEFVAVKTFNNEEHRIPLEDIFSGKAIKVA